MSASSPRRRLGFTLIELIGVLAIIAILAATLTPNVIRATDRATIEAESTNLKAIASYLEDYARINGQLPAPPPQPYPHLADPAYEPTWHDAVVSFSDRSPLDLLWNKRNAHRRYLVDPADPQRALLVSSMNASLPLPATLNFGEVWNTRDGDVNPNFGGGWIVNDAGRFLVIHRINLRSTLREYEVVLQNMSQRSGDAFAAGGNGQGNNGNGNGNGGSGGNGNNGGGNGGGDADEDTGGVVTPPNPRDAYYRVLTATGPSGYTRIAQGEIIDLDLRANDRVELYLDDNGVGLQLVHVVSTTGKVFTFTNQHVWVAQ